MAQVHFFVCKIYLFCHHFPLAVDVWQHMHIFALKSKKWSKANELQTPKRNKQGSTRNKNTSSLGGLEVNFNCYSLVMSVGDLTVSESRKVESPFYKTFKKITRMLSSRFLSTNKTNIVILFSPSSGYFFLRILFRVSSYNHSGGGRDGVGFTHHGILR